MKLLPSLMVLAALGGCASLGEKYVPDVPLTPDPAPVSRSADDIQKINLLERQLAEKQRQCLVDKRRMEVALKDNQKQVVELQQKLDALLTIDRELRQAKKSR